MNEVSSSPSDYGAHAAPLLKELAEADFLVESVVDLYKRGHDYEDAAPILLRWLPLIDDEQVKQSIVPALRIKKLRRIIVPVLLAEFRKLPEEPYHTTKSLIGDVLTYLAEDRQFDEIASLLRDKSHGASRQMLVYALAKMKNRASDAVALLDQMLAEDDMPGHVFITLRKLNGKPARANVERYLNSRVTWVRDEAKRAMRGLDAK